MHLICLPYAYMPCPHHFFLITYIVTSYQPSVVSASKQHWVAVMSVGFRNGTALMWWRHALLCLRALSPRPSDLSVGHNDIAAARRWD
jgi:hypothetical protein